LSFKVEKSDEEMINSKRIFQNFSTFSNLNLSHLRQVTSLPIKLATFSKQKPFLAVSKTR